jgi:hypothetical protein
MEQKVKICLQLEQNRYIMAANAQNGAPQNAVTQNGLLGTLDTGS